MLPPSERVERMLEQLGRSVAGRGAEGGSWPTGFLRSTRTRCWRAAAPARQLRRHRRLRPRRPRHRRGHRRASTSRPSMREDNLRRLDKALDDLDAAPRRRQAGSTFDERPRASRCSSCEPARASSSSFPSRRARAAATTISAARRAASRSAGDCAPSRLDRRPRAHARRPRPRSRHARTLLRLRRLIGSSEGSVPSSASDADEASAITPPAYRNYQRR